MTQEREHTYDRRTFLGRTARVGAGILVAGAAPAAVARPARAARRGGESITVGLHDFLNEPFKPVLDQFTKQTGINVELTGVPSAGGDQVTQLTPQFASGSTPIDVFESSDEATPSFISANWLEPITDIWTGVKADYPADMQQYVGLWSSKGANVYRIPNSWSVGFFWVRHDVLRELGAGVPADWDALLALVAKAKQKKMWVFADAASKPSLAFVYMAYVNAQTGGSIFKFDNKTREAFSFSKELIDKGAFPKSALNWTYDQLNANYMNNQILTMREWNFFLSVAEANKKWFKPARAEIVLPPAGPAGRGTWAGAWGWAIPKFSDKKDEAKEFVKFFSSKQSAVALAKANSYALQPRKSVVSALSGDYIVKKMGEYSKAGVVKARPFHPNPGQAQAVVDTMVTGYLSGQISLDKAMSDGKKQISQI
jgi:multiple sugar transport system substrate-binding protein